MKKYPRLSLLLLSNLLQYLPLAGPNQKPGARWKNGLVGEAGGGGGEEAGVRCSGGGCTLTNPVTLRLATFGSLLSFRTRKWRDEDLGFHMEFGGEQCSLK